MLSIITPVLNGSRFLESNILSIMELDIPYEHIIVDGGSTDGSLEIASRYPHIRFLQQRESSGMYGAIHQGISESTGAYLCYINSDDMILESGFRQMYELICSKENPDLVYSNGYFLFIGKSLFFPVLGKQPFRYFMTHGILPFLQPSTIFTREIYTRTGGLRYHIFRFIGDFDLFQRFALDPSFKVKYLPVFSTIFRRHDTSLYYSNLEKAAKEHENLLVPRKLTFLTKFYFNIQRCVSLFKTLRFYLRKR